MILTVTPNPALDLTYTVPHLRLGASHRVDPPAVRAGGKGINVARVLHEQGISAHVLATAGGPSGRRLGRDLDRCGLPHTLVPVAAATRSTLALVSETTTNLNESGAALAAAEWDALLEAADREASAAAVLVISGSIPMQTPTDLLPRLIAVGHAHGIPVIADTSGEHLRAAAGAGAEVLKPNEAELLAAFGGTDVTAAAREAAARSGGTVLVSLGPKGMIAVGQRGPITCARPGRALAGNTTGAGDAAVAAIAASLARDPAALTADPAGTLRTAVAWSGAAVLAPLAGSITDPGPLMGAVTITEV